MASFPNYPEKYALESLINADDMLAYRHRLGRMPGLIAPHGILFCMDRSLPERMRRRIPIRRAGSMEGDVYEVKRKKNKVGVLTSFGIGSAALVELAEELAVMGTKKMLVMTFAGALQPELCPGDIVVCDRAIRDDGVSQHYLAPGKYVYANSLLAEQLVEEIQARGAQCSLGATWTTSAPYRETRQEVQQYQSEGVKVVEMESAGLFTIGQVRGIKTASVVVVMDSLATFEWKTPEKLDGIFRSLELVYAACIDALAVD